MDNMTNSDWVRSQYADKSKLQTRISIHEKYSTNPQSYADWLLTQYPIHAGDDVLELGCGTGSMWKGRIERLPCGCHVTLTDISPAMVDAAREQLADVRGVKFECADIQNLPYPDASFDVVIANMMLYHVPDIARGLSEVRRVLRRDGRFFCSTYGENGLGRFIDDVMADLGSHMVQQDSFTLQNGEVQLKPFFSEVTRMDYTDELRVTDARDLADYIRSMQGVSLSKSADDEELLNRLNARRQDGAIRVPKEYGCFIARV